MTTRVKKKAHASRATARRAPPKARMSVRLDPDAPGLDEETRARRRVLAKIRQMTPDELHRLFVDAGIYTEDGQLAAPYRGDEPSAYRPTN